MSATMTIRRESAPKQRLDHLTDATQRSKSFPAARTIRELVDLDEWQVQEIRNALAEADNEEFASDDLVREVPGRWGVDAGQVAPAMAVVEVHRHRFAVEEFAHMGEAGIFAADELRLPVDEFFGSVS